MSDGSIIKADKDFTPEVDAALPEADKLAKVCLDALSGNWEIVLI
jgi:hypothetical protein